ncbi:MAG TPA: prolyl oligopeptidase family serine peptidase [Kofleriaceae bacterium]|nr:prolyl oligopeptidase family serine peptidase [Kofleriaceae bacterium]
MAAPTFAQPKYPATRTVDAADTYFGKTFKDPYRWLEQLKDKDVAAWFKANADITDALLAKIPGRDQLVKEWTELDKLQPASYSAIVVEHGRVFYKKTLGGENVGRLFYRDGWTGKEKLLFDPAGYKPGVTTTIQSALPSWDGKLVVLALSSGGAEFSELRVLDVARGTLLADTMYPSYGPIGWMKDSKAFMYDAGNVTDIKSLDIEQNRKTRVHVVGSDPAGDRDMFSNASNPELNIAAKEFPQAYIDETYPDYLLGTVGTVQPEIRLFMAPTSELNKKTITWNAIADVTDHLVRGFALWGDRVFAVTYDGAPRYKLVSTSVKHPDWRKATVVLPEAADSIQYIAKSKSMLFVVYSNGITGRIVKLDLRTNKTSEVRLPTTGTADISCPDAHSNRCIASVSSWTAPTTLYDVDGDRGTVVKSVFNTDVTYPGFDQLVADEVEVPGHDGVMIPLSIIHRKDLVLDGSSSAILEGYGAYGISYTPFFTVRTSVALHGVVVAYAHVRGGSEKGDAWYKAGYKTTKPNTWKDFISCAEYLVAKGYTSKQHLAGTGTSAGGVLISRAITERPDLFAAAVVNVGVANALRAEFSPNGPVNTPEFGTVQKSDEIDALAEMDGVSHVKKGVRYPAVMGVAGWNDPRVAPWQPGKFIAAMQAATASGKPVLMKVNYDDGHFTEEKTVTFKNFAGQYAFMLWQAGSKDFQPTR